MFFQETGALAGFVATTAAGSAASITADEGLSSSAETLLPAGGDTASYTSTSAFHARNLALTALAQEGRLAFADMLGGRMLSTMKQAVIDGINAARF